MSESGIWAPVFSIEKYILSSSTGFISIIIWLLGSEYFIALVTKLVSTCSILKSSP